MSIPDDYFECVNSADVKLWKLEELPRETRGFMTKECVILPKKYIGDRKIPDQTKYNADMTAYLPWLSGIIKNMDNLVVAGSCALLPVSPIKYTPGDIDIFIYGLDEDEIYKKCQEFIDRLIDSSKNCPCGKGCNKPQITVAYLTGIFSIKYKYIMCGFRQYRTVKIQLLLRVYEKNKSKEEGIYDILRKFDLPSCSVAWDGNTTYFTTLGARSCIDGLNYVNPLKSSESTISRLRKYFRRGFGVILPHFDMKNSDTFQFKYFKFTKISNYKNIYIAKELTNTFNPKKISDYEIQPLGPYDKNIQSIEHFGNFWKIYERKLTDPSDVYNTLSNTIISKILSEKDYIETIREFLNEDCFGNEYVVTKILNLEKSDYTTKPYITIIGDKEKLIAERVENYQKQKDNRVSWIITPPNDDSGSLFPCSDTIQDWYGKSFSKIIFQGVNYQEYQEYLITPQESKYADNPCILCQADLLANETNTTILQCGHRFHTFNVNDTCIGIMGWFLNKRKPWNCPVCTKNATK
jgi:hypothetical protein